jgi:hypothetical protein
MVDCLQENVNPVFVITISPIKIFPMAGNIKMTLS